MTWSRIFVAGSHCLIAFLIGSGGLSWLFQGRLAILWEQTFYGQTSSLSKGILTAAVMILVIATVQAVSAIGYAFQLRAGAWGLLGVSMMLWLATPPPYSWLAAASAGLLGFQLWVSRPIPPVDEALNEDEP